ncbi:MAG TPA: rhodanese-like domain-containing protein [Longimicrobiales bacterium]|nr:rhodanese-like domain-containing protein [Longimicrobiales bacterium]
MFLRTIYDDKLAQASYLIGCQETGDAIVVDPNRDAQQYVRLARKEGLRITHVTETHIHADFLSGTRELAHATGATMHLPQQLNDGDVFNIGNIKFEVMHTPGHTPEHVCFLVTDTKTTDAPMGVLSGDFVFVGDVGRPDLLERAVGMTGTMEDSARQLFKSLQRFRQLPDYLQVWPGHGAGSACGKALGAVPQSTVGYEKLFSPPFSFQKESEFIDFILSGQPEPPRYFAVMKRMNADGPAILGDLPKPRVLEANELTKYKHIVDTRAALTYGKGHINGSINVPYNKAFPSRAGMFLPYDEEIVLIADPNLVNDIARDLALIGIDNVAGHVPIAAINDLATEQMPTIRTKEIVDALDDENTVVIDVRGASEYEEGHIDGAINISLPTLADRLDEIPRDKKLVIHCEAGGRSAVAASVLQEKGYDAVNVLGGWTEWASMYKVK